MASSKKGPGPSATLITADRAGNGVGIDRHERTPTATVSDARGGVLAGRALPSLRRRAPVGCPAAGNGRGVAGLAHRNAVECRGLLYGASARSRVAVPARAFRARWHLGTRAPGRSGNSRMTPD